MLIRTPQIRRPIRPVAFPLASPLSHLNPDPLANRKCLALDGNGHAIHADDPDLDMGVGDFAIGQWIKGTFLADVWLYKGADPYYRVSTRGDLTAGYTELRLRNGAWEPAVATTSKTNDGRWHYIFCFADRDGNLVILFDGIQEGSLDISANASDTLSAPGATFYLARNLSGSGLYQQALFEFFYLGKDGLNPAEAVTYAAARFADPYGPLRKVMPDWGDYAAADRSEMLSETDFTTHLNWTVTNDWDDTGGNAHYSYSDSQNSYIYQTVTGVVGNAYYEFKYEVTDVTVVPDGLIRIFSGGNNMARNHVNLDVTLGTHRKVFRAAATSGSKEFNIQASNDNTEGNITLDNVSLTQIGRFVSWPMNGNYSDVDEEGDAGPNTLDLSAAGTGNRFERSSLIFYSRR